MIKIVKEHIEFHYLLNEIELYTLIISKYTSQEIWNNIRGKSIIHNIFKKQDNESNVELLHGIYACSKK